VPWYQFRPLVSWPVAHTTGRKPAPFRTHTGNPMPLSDTMEILRREIRALGATETIVQVALQPRDIRNDGMIRADARQPAHPGVIVTFESRYGPLSYPCDKFTKWQDNLRAIAIALESLRRVDRFGVTRSGEQYKGWVAIPPKPAIWHPQNANEAAGFIVEILEPGSLSKPAGRSMLTLILDDLDASRAAYRRAAKILHPDNGNGDEERFKWLQACWSLLETRHGGVA
jgi:hypothetical protein